MAEGTKAGAGRARVSEVPRPEDPAGRPPVCTVAFCPICLAVTTARSVAPDAVDHLLTAAREFLLAARAVVDARADDLSGHGRPPRNDRLQRIDIA